MSRPGSWPHRARRALAAVALALALLPAAQAHLMVAQRGTLNIVDDGAFLVLSLPVSSLSGVDDDRDGRLSTAELRQHADEIRAQVRQGVQLRDGGDGAQALPLQGLLLQLSSPDPEAPGAAHQILVLGRFALGGRRSDLRLRLTLFGTAGEERSQEITVSRGDQVQRLLLEPGRDEARILPGAAVTLVDHLVQGMTHVLSGPDHLLFLLVVLASGWGFRPVVRALSCFTIGHGITLAAVALGGIAVPAAVVEPAIAATLICLAGYDRWMHRRQLAGAGVGPPGVRLGLVFAGALIHGLGLAGGLGDLGLDRGHRLWSLAGFNTGIEAGQLAVALAATAVVLGIRRVGGGHGLALGGSLACGVAMTAGSLWLVQRVIVAP